MPPATLLIKPVSDNCNMRCQYCFYAGSAKRGGVASFGVMTPGTRDELVRKALNYADGSCSFGFQGGEPTLAGLDFYKEIIGLQREYNRKNVKIINTIQTNGYRLGREWAEFLSQNNFLTGLSLDGVKDVHDSYRKGTDGLGTFDGVAATADLFVECNVEFNILCVVNNLVASRPEATYSTLRKYGYLQFIPCIGDTGPGMSSLRITDADPGVRPSRSAEANPGAPLLRSADTDPSTPPPYSLDAGAYAQFLIKTFDMYYDDYMRGDYVSVRNYDNYIGMLLGNPPEQCGMSGVCAGYFLVEADGSVYPCDFYVSEEWKLGNVNEKSFAAMMKTSAAREFVEISHRAHAGCGLCEWRALCRGGCRRHREPIRGGVPSMNVHCGAYKEFFSHSYEKMRRIASKQQERQNKL